MDKFDRIYQLHSILSSRKTPIGECDLTDRLECSRPTLYRDIALLRDHLGAPIEFDRARRGYVYKNPAGVPKYELPGLWFSAAELYCLTVMQRLLSEVGGGLLSDQVEAMGKRLNHLLSHRRLNLGEASKRLRFPTVAARPAGEAFQCAASATLQRKKLRFEYHSRGNDRRSKRTVSPQRIVHYRNAWYLDTWDEGSGELRTFSLDRIRQPHVLPERAKDISDAELDEHFGSGYGIFSGKADKIAVMVFDSERARWVAEEEWHPRQRGTFRPDGSYELQIPYRDHRELVMDVLRHGPHVRVLEPASLVEEVKSQLAGTLRHYADST